MTALSHPNLTTSARLGHPAWRGGLFCVPLLWAAVCSGQAASQTEAPSLRRIIHQFDFDESQEGNFDSLPMHWRKVDGDVFPGFAQGALDLEVGHDAPPSFYLRADGRNVAYWYQGPANTVQPNSEHLIIGFIRPDQLNSARATLSAYYLDRQRLPIADTQVFAELIGPDTEDDPWHQIEIRLPAAPQGAHTIGLTAWLVQAIVWDPRSRPHRHIELPDVEGGAWFDDLTIYRMPSAHLIVEAPGNIFIAPDEPEFQVTAADADAGGMEASLEVRSADGEVVYQAPVPVQTTDHAQPDLIRLAGLQPGLYEATLAITAGPTTTLSRRVRFAQLAPILTPGTGVAEYFGIALKPGTPVEPRTTQAMLAALGTGAVKIPVWGRSVLATAEPGKSSETDELLHELVKARVNLTGVLSAPPAELVESAGSFARSLLDILSDDPAGWRAQLAVVVASYASVFRAWQIGADGDAAVVGNPDLLTALRNVRDEMVPLLTTVDITIPGDAGAAPQGLTLPAEEITVRIGGDIHGDWIPSHLDGYRQLEYPWLSAYVAVGSGAQYARLPFLAEFARRVIRTRHAGVATTYVPQLWHARSTLSGPVTEPSETFIAYRTLIDMLGELTIGPRLSLAPGVEAFAFHDVDESVLVLWDPSAPPQGTIHRLQLGAAHRQIDLWGRVTELTPLEDGWREVSVYAQPTFIDGVDRWLVDFVAGVALEPNQVEVSVLPQAHLIKLTNTGTQPRSGRLVLQTPAHWEVRPSAFAFHLAPYSTHEQSVEIRYGHNEPAGFKRIQAAIEFSSEPRLKLQVPLTVELGIKDVDVWGFALLEGDRLVLRHGITNRSASPLSLRSFATVPGRSRQFRVIASLAPGATTIAEYHFSRADALANRTIRLGLREINGTRTHSIELTAP